MASSQIHDFANPPTNAYNETTPANNSSSNPSATGPTGSTVSTDGVTGSYGNTHSSTSRANPIHPSNPQSTSHPAYGNSTFSSPYETGGGNTGQGDGLNAGVGAGLGSVGQGGLGQQYHDNVDGAYGRATGEIAPEGHGRGEGRAGSYDTAGGNSAQTSAAQTSTHMGGATQPSTSTTNKATTNTYTGETADNRSTGSKVKEMAQGVKGLVAAVHGAGESVRGNFNAGVDRTFHEVLDPHPIPFPSLRPLGEYAEDGEGEFPSSVYASTSPTSKKIRIVQNIGEGKER